MVQAGRTFRIFVSSTFGDLGAERDALQRYVFPRLRELCRAHGTRFQAIDLRWGVSEEASRDQQTVRICLEEIARCQRVTPRPNFIILLGDRYGWQPLPEELPADELEALAARMTPEQRSLLFWHEHAPGGGGGWYRRDDDAVPPVYMLQPRSGAYVDWTTWRERVEQPLREAMRTAAAKAGADSPLERMLNRLLPPMQRRPVRAPKRSAEVQRKFEASVTHQEIERGLEVEDADQHVFGFFRRIANLEEMRAMLPDTPARDYLDTDSAGSHDAEAHARLAALKEDLRRRLGQNVREYQATWTGAGITTGHIGSLPEDLAACQPLLAEEPALSEGEGYEPPTLCEAVYRALGRVILSECGKLEEKTALQAEVEAHEAFAQERRRHFVGRAAILGQIAGYLAGASPQPLGVWGESGTGKTALMAEAIRKAHAAHPSAAVIYRFIGATPDSTSGRALLEGLCRQVSEQYGTDASGTPLEYKDLVSELPKRLALATAGRPLILFLDALDQLSDTDNARNLVWLPKELPAHVKLVASTLPGECLDTLKWKLPKEQRLELEPMSAEEGERLLQDWLSSAGRALRPEQRAEVLVGFRRCGLPLYLRLAFEEARRWRSYDGVPDLGADVPGVLGSLFTRLSDAANHGEALVSRGLGYLAAARNGLTEDELLDVLSGDGEVMDDFRRRSPKSPKMHRLPYVVWSRLYHDLEPYLEERTADGTSLLGFYHRQVAATCDELFLASQHRPLTHRALAQYFALRWQAGDRHALRELTYQLQVLGDWPQLAETLGDLPFLGLYCAAFGPHELLALCDACLAQIRADTPFSGCLQAASETLGAYSTLLSREPGALLQQLYLTVFDRYWADDRVRDWGQKALGRSGQRQRLQVVGDRRAPRPPLIRDLGMADDFVPEIGAGSGFGTIFSASMSGQLRRIETASGRLDAEYRAHTANVLCLRVIEDRILLGLTDGSVIAWDGDYGLRTAFSGGQHFSANAIAESPVDGRLLVGSGQWAAQAQTGCIYVLDSSDFRVLGRLALDDRIVLEWAETWRQKRIVNPGGTQVNVMVRRPHSHEVAVAFHHGEVSLHDFDRDQWRRVYLNPRHAVYGLVCTPDGDRLIFTDGGSRLLDFDLRAWKTRHQLDLQVDLTALALAFEQNMLVVGDTRGMLYFVRADNLKVVESFPADVGGSVRSICCDPHGERFAVSGRGVRLYTLPTSVDDTPAGTEWGWQAERADGSAIQRLCVGTTSGWGARLVHLDTNSTRDHADLWSLRCAKNAPLALAWDSTAKMELVTLPDLDVLARWDESSIFGAAISTSGDWAAIISGEGRGLGLSVYRLLSGGRQVKLEKRLPLNSRPAAFAPVVFSDDASSIAAVTAASARIVQERQNGMLQGRLEKCLGQVLVYHIPGDSARTLAVECPVGALAFAPDCSILFVAPGAQYVLSPISGGQLMRIEARHLLDSRPDSDRHAIRAYDIGGLDEIYRLVGHTDSVTAIQPGPDGRELLSISEDLTLRLWDLASVRCDAVVGLESRPLWCAFASEATFDVVWSGWRANARLFPRQMVKMPAGSTPR